MTASDRPSGVLAHWRAIVFTVIGVCLAGVYSGYTMPSSVFPETHFPRVVILIDNGVMPADAMMATVTRPVEEAMEGIPGATNVRCRIGNSTCLRRVLTASPRCWSRGDGGSEGLSRRIAARRTGRLSARSRTGGDRRSPMRL